ncbi:MAG: hypothetical protein D6725_00025 [Planctomycetota bacterium]|nr:MAG: hypothetical protein D6725_00025 [Planctomycetota bacterium]
MANNRRRLATVAGTFPVRIPTAHAVPQPSYSNTVLRRAAVGLLATVLIAATQDGLASAQSGEQPASPGAASAAPRPTDGGSLASDRAPEEKVPERAGTTAHTQTGSAAGKHPAAESIFSEDVRDVLLDPLVFAPTRHPKKGITTRGVRPEERAAYYFVLDFVRKADQRLLKRAARELVQHRLKLPEYQRYRDNPGEFPVYYDLFRHPEIYHGKPVTLRGHIRKLISYPADDNEYGIQRLYEAWLFTPDSQTNPAVVVCTEIPEGIPTGGDILVDGVSVTGYYFKNFGYTAQDRPRFAPMILAKRLEWRPEQAGTSEPLVPPAVRNTVVVLALVLILILLYRYERRDTRQHAELQRRMLLEGEPATAVLGPESAPQRSADRPPEPPSAEPAEHAAAVSAEDTAAEPSEHAPAETSRRPPDSQPTDTDDAQPTGTDESPQPSADPQQSPQSGPQVPQTPDPGADQPSRDPTDGSEGR